MQRKCSKKCLSKMYGRCAHVFRRFSMYKLHIIFLGSFHLIFESNQFSTLDRNASLCPLLFLNARTNIHIEIYSNSKTNRLIFFRVFFLLLLLLLKLSYYFTNYSYKHFFLSFHSTSICLWAKKMSLLFYSFNVLLFDFIEVNKVRINTFDSHIFQCLAVCDSRCYFYFLFFFWLL